MFEKAWAKVKGNYAQAEGGFTDEGLRALTGSPSFNYNTEIVLNSSFWQMLYDSYQSNYILLATTPPSQSGQTYNEINIAYSHAYSVLNVFNLTADDGTVYQCAMVRNPWGYSYYNGTLSSADPIWTSNTINQVPLGVNPKTDGTKYGIFIVPLQLFNYFDYFIISHEKDS